VIFITVNIVVQALCNIDDRITELEELVQLLIAQLAPEIGV